MASNPKTIKVRYGKDTTEGNQGSPISPPSGDEVVPESEPPAKKTRAKRVPTQAQKEALAKAREVLLENKRKEREAKQRLKEQEKEIDKVILEKASKGIELRMKMAELKKQMEELAEEERKEAEAMEVQPPPPPPQPQPEPVPVPEPKQVDAEVNGTEPEEKEIKLKTPRTKTAVKKQKQGGRKVILIDSSIFDESGSSGSEEVEVKRIRQPLKEPRLRADRRTRFRRDPDLVYPGPYGDDDYEDHRVYRQDTQSPEPDDDYYNQTTTLQNVRIQNEQPRSVAVPPPPPVNPPVYSYEQLRNENPLFSRIFG